MRRRQIELAGIELRDVGEQLGGMRVIVSGVASQALTECGIRELGAGVTGHDSARSGARIMRGAVSIESHEFTTLEEPDASLQ